ncbi:phage tail sheath protein FI [Sphingobium sp. B1D7B]|uniref:phage tail sheath subtilisin-like domain-containing protein n=1 Tax=Sphingobium sp. B1D7B TaxID=2940578 RepID=UPI00222472B8|nr:phage tail sheath subtilisin-like domain-containing protein [Sphingobium sp. B1D7B]MCW2405273.1 phage tail sheath protein FI [Sphingobium sp. B1D7B]
MAIIHGIKVNEINTGARAVAAASTAIIGLVATASDADVTTFPVNTPVPVTNVTAAIAKAGAAGTLAKALDAIADQCSPIVVVVRVETGVDAEATETNTKAGVAKLLQAESTLGIRPRILGAPGLDTAEVINDLVTVAQKLRGFAYAAASGDDLTEVTDFAGDFGQRELMLIWPEFTDWTGSAVARALGLRAKIDSETGWHKTLSNMPINGVTGIATPVDFDLLGGASSAGLLNDKNVTTLIRANGFRFWGNRTMASEPLFAFESVVRTAQVLMDEIANGLLWAIDKPITASLVKDIVETVNGRFRTLVSQGRIVGARCWFDADANPAASLAAGSITIDYEYTACAPAEAILLNQRITDKFYASIADQLG